MSSHRAPGWSSGRIAPAARSAPPLAPAAVARGRIDRLRVMRLPAGTWSGDALAGEQGVVVLVAFGAPSRISLHRSSVVLEPGRIGVFAGALDAPASSILVGGELGIVVIPRLLALPWSLGLPRREPIQVDARAGVPGVVAHLLATLTAGDVEPAENPAWLAQRVVEFIRLAWSDHPSGPETRGSLLLREAMEYIDEHLGEPGLTLDRVAGATRVSTRTLQRAFGPEGLTAGAWIRHRRLERCRSGLADPGLAGYSVGEVASRWGFTDPAHFSRLFKAAYGVSPRVYRAAQHGRVPERRVA